MSAWSMLTGRTRFDVACTVEVENTFENLHAHVRLAGDLPLYPGDTVLVHGKPVAVPYGARASFERVATITRAGWAERAWTKVRARTELLELCDIGFSEGATT